MNVHSLSTFLSRHTLTDHRHGGLLPPVKPKPVRSNRLKLDTGILRQFPPSDRYLIAVSGGRDSVALLHCLRKNGYRKLIVCHLDHRLRGRSSAADARFVAKLAGEAGLPFVEGTADVRSLARESKQSLETAARAARLNFFAAVARRRRCATIFLGHHADDLVETFLMHLFRGAGRGGRAIRFVTAQSVGGTSLTVVRPLLNVWRREIDDCVERECLRFRDDATNASLDATRNRMRHKIIPALEKEFGRSIRKTIWRAAMVSLEEDALLESLLPRELQEGDELKVASLRKQPCALQRRAIRDWLRRHAVSDVRFDLIEDIRGLLDLDIGPAKVNLPGDRYARRRAGKLFIE